MKRIKHEEEKSKSKERDKPTIKIRKASEIYHNLFSNKFQKTLQNAIIFGNSKVPLIYVHVNIFYFCLKSWCIIAPIRLLD